MNKKRLAFSEVRTWGLPVAKLEIHFRMVDDNKDLKQKLIELDRILEEKIRQRDAKIESTQLKM